MEVELFEQLLLDAGAHAVAEERAVRYDDGSTRGPFRRRGPAVQLTHDQLKEEERGLGRLPVIGEVALDALLLLSAERRVGEDHVHAVFLADRRELVAQ